MLKILQIALFRNFFQKRKQCFNPWVWFISLTRCELDRGTIEMWSSNSFTHEPLWAVTHTASFFFCLLKPEFSWTSINCFHGFVTRSDRQGSLVAEWREKKFRMTTAFLIISSRWRISIGNSMNCSDIWHKYHQWYFEIVISNFTSR